MNVPLTPIRFKERAARLYGTKTGVVCGQERFTYAQFAQRSNQCGNALQALGLRPKDRVAYLSFNCHRLLEAYYGVLQAGGILLPLNLRLRPEELAGIVADAGAKFLFYDAEFAPMVQACSRSGVVHAIPLTAGNGEISYESLIASAPDHYHFDMGIDEDEVAELFYTSGTTGNNKGVMLTHRNLYLHAYSNMATLRPKDSEVYLHTIPLFHVNGWGSPHTVTATGGRHVMLRRFDPAEVLHLIEREKVTTFCLVPTMAIALLQAQEKVKADLSSVQHVMIGGAASNPTLIANMRKVFCDDVRGGYGLTETSPVATTAHIKDTLLDHSLEERTNWLATAGIEFIGMEARVVDAEGKDVKQDGKEVGEVVLRGDAVMKGYWNQPEATREAIKDGWFHTGDMGVIDSENYLLIVDRKKDIIVSGGENIPSLEIENVLYAHPDVLECAVIPIPDERWGEAPCALIVTRSGKPISAEEMDAYCRKHLAAFKVPKVFHFREALPKGGTGKILKRELREPFWAGHTKRVH
ncbi:MAG TPA: long-chain-fatty-acid--CoA ligase [Acidobacteriota bacterium]|jgi:fatty-acyl-CoA synthase